MVRAALIASLVLLMAPAAAAADSSAVQFVVGPVAVGHGYQLWATSDGPCNTGGPPSLAHPAGRAAIEFIKRVPGGIEEHSYAGNPAKATCNLSTGAFKLSLGRLATIDVTFHHHGRPRKEQGSLLFGCGGSRPLIQPGMATGTFRVDIDPSFFGSVNVRRTGGSIQRQRSPRCDQNVEMLADFGSTLGAPLLVARAAPGGGSTLVIESAQIVNRSVIGNHAISLAGGAALFSPASDLSSATVTGPGGPVTGRLSFSNPQHAYSGSLTGSLTVAFDVIGAKLLAGSVADGNPGPELFGCGPGATTACF